MRSDSKVEKEKDSLLTKFEQALANCSISSVSSGIIRPLCNSILFKILFIRHDII